MEYFCSVRQNSADFHKYKKNPKTCLVELMFDLHVPRLYVRLTEKIELIVMSILKDMNQRVFVHCTLEFSQIKLKIQKIG